MVKKIKFINEPEVRGTDKTIKACWWILEITYQILVISNNYKHNARKYYQLFIIFLDRWNFIRVLHVMLIKKYFDFILHKYTNLVKSSCQSFEVPKIFLRRFVGYRWSLGSKWFEVEIWLKINYGHPDPTSQTLILRIAQKFIFHQRYCAYFRCFCVADVAIVTPA